MRIDELTPLLRTAIPDLAAVYVFGSVARGDETFESDVDLAVLAPRPLEPLSRWHLQERVAAALGRNVDLVDLRSASTVLRVQVLRDGRLLSDLRPTERATFEATALSMYARLQEERRGILDDVARRGHVHG